MRKLPPALVARACVPMLLLVGSVLACGSGEVSGKAGADPPAAAASKAAGANGGTGGGRPPVAVVVATLAEREFVDTIEALGTARANESVTITAQVTETVSEVRFEDGQRVAAGDILVELTSREETAQLAEARANFEEAKRQYRRSVELAAGGTVSKALLDERTAARDAARARLGELQARLRDRLVRAPFSGVLGLRAVSRGSLLTPGDEITTLDDIETIKLDFSVPERFLSSLRVGLPVTARAAAYPDRIFRGTVSAIDTRVDPRTRAARVRALIPNADHELRPGMLLTVGVRSRPRRALALPEQAVVPEGAQQFVFVLGDDLTARRVEVVTGRRQGGMLEVLSGLDGSETVVLEGGSELRRGAPVRIVAREVPRTDEEANRAPL